MAVSLMASQMSRKPPGAGGQGQGDGGAAAAAWGLGAQVRQVSGVGQCLLSLSGGCGRLPQGGRQSEGPGGSREEVWTYARWAPRPSSRAEQGCGLGSVQVGSSVTITTPGNEKSTWQSQSAILR